MEAEYFKSKRLVYTAIEESDEPFLLSLNSDIVGHTNSDASPLKPPSKEGAKGMHKWLSSCQVNVLICLPPYTEAAAQFSTAVTADASTSKPTPIGFIALSTPGPREAIHRDTLVAIGLVAPYQGKGYGSEAINWVLDFGFGVLGLHRISIGCYEWNDGARRLYEKLGFVAETRKRKAVWHLGRWWDLIELGMLEDEWREKLGKERFDANGGLIFAK